MSCDPHTIAFTPRDLGTTVRYAGASGDFNPLHYDPPAAAAAGFDRVLVHGGYLAAYVEAVLRQQVGQAPSRYAVRFERPVRVGEALTTETQRSDRGATAVLRGDTVEDRRISAEYLIGNAALSIDRPDDFEPLSAPYPWIVEHGALRDFRHATAEAVCAVEEVPLCFLGNAARWSPARESIVRRLRFDYRHLLHGSTTIELTGAAIRIGETLHVTEAFGNREDKPHRSGGTMRIADTIHEIADADGTVRARVVNRMIERPGGGSA